MVTQPASPGRNDPCPCGSGRKYKQCHLRPTLDDHAFVHRLTERAMEGLT